MSSLIDGTYRPVEIFYVEDNPGDLRLFYETLKSIGIPNSLNSVDTGELASDYLAGRFPYNKRELPDIIVLDVNLPVKSGIEILQEIKQDPVLQSIPVVLLTSAEDASYLEDALNYDAMAFIPKPLSSDDLLNIINRGFLAC